MPGHRSSILGMAMYEMDIRTRQCRRIVFRDGSRPIDTFSIPPALVRPYKNGIIFCDEKHGVFEVREGSLIADLLIPLPGGDDVGGITLVEDRYMFFRSRAAPNFTFENQNGKWTKISHLFDNLYWSCIIYDKKDQTYWVGKKNGIVHYDKEFRTIRSYSHRDRYNESMENMQVDNDGNLWYLNTLRQVSRLNPVTGVFTNLLETDGYYKQDYGADPPGAKDARGNIYFGIGLNRLNTDSTAGLDRIYPERYSPLHTATVYFNSLTVNQKSLPLSAGVNNVEQLNLEYDQNTIGIETGNIDFYSKGNGQVRYKLEQNGKNEDWQYAPDYYTIRYEDLSTRETINFNNAGWQCSQ